MRYVLTLTFVVATVIAWIQWCEPRDPEPLLPIPQETVANEPNQSKVRPGAIIAGRVDKLRIATFDQLLAILRTTKASGSAAEVEMLLHEIAQHRPALAIELAREISDTQGESSQWTFALAGDWAEQDAEAAWHWLDQLSSRPDVAGNLSLLNVILDQMAVQNPARLVEISGTRLHESEPTSGLEPQVMAHACMDALIKSGNSALARDTVEKWAKSVDASPIGAAALESIALHTARSSPSDAAEWLKGLPVSDARNFAAGTLASDWASRDPQAALQWAATLGADEGRREAMQRAYSQWVEQDPAGAAVWLNRDWSRLQSDAQTDRMVTNLIAASPMVRTDGEGALLWASLIAEPNLRSDVIGGLFSRWLRSDQAAAISHLNQNVELTPQEKAKILRSFLESRADDVNEE